MDRDAVLISLHPQHATKILSGEKRLEFRRVWASRPVSSVVIYATAPVSRIVAVAKVKQVHEGSATALWSLCQQKGGGLTRRALYDYFRGKKRGFAVELASVRAIQPGIGLCVLREGFRPPQSLQYLSQAQLNRILRVSATEIRRHQVIFVGGIHGVGKSTVCDRLSRATGILYRSAGQLIKEAAPEALDSSSKQVKDPARNQRLLIEQVSKITSAGRSLLLDGHFALLNTDGCVEPIPETVFRDLDISAVLVLTLDPSRINDRLAERDDKSIPVEVLDELQRAEVSSAKATARSLNVPLFKLDASDGDDVYAEASRILAEHGLNVETGVPLHADFGSEPAPLAQTI